MKTIKFEKSNLPSVRGVAFSASRSNLFVSFMVRGSFHSASGFVAVASFSILNHARLFASAWSKRLPRSIGFCAIRKNYNGNFDVSVPVRPVSVPSVVFDHQFDDDFKIKFEGSSISILKYVLFNNDFKPNEINAVPLPPGLCCRLGLCNSH